MKTLILLFATAKFDEDEVKDFEDRAYSIAKKGVSESICDIYTCEDFFAVWNKCPNDLDGWYAVPCYVDDATYNEWWK
jgi:hypothetical protein